MGKGGPLAFLAKKPWHPLNARNQEEIWKREQAHLKEMEKVEELKRKVEEERHQEQFDSFVADATKQTKQERVEWMYQGSLAAQEASEKRKEEYLLGKAVDVLPDAQEEPQSRVDAVAQGPSTAAVDFNANETWSRLNADPMLLMKRLEVNKVKQVTSNPYLVAQLKEQLRAARGKSEKKKSSKHKKEKKEKRGKREKRERKRSSSSSPEPELEPRSKRRRSGSGSLPPREAQPQPRAHRHYDPGSPPGLVRRDDRSVRGDRDSDRRCMESRDRDADRVRENGHGAWREVDDLDHAERDRGGRRDHDAQADRAHDRRREGRNHDGDRTRDEDRRHVRGDSRRHSPERRHERARERDGGDNRARRDRSADDHDRADRRDRSPRDHHHDRESGRRRATPPADRDRVASDHRRGGDPDRDADRARIRSDAASDARQRRPADYGLQDSHVPEYAAGRESQAELTRRAHEERIRARQREEAEVAERAAAARRGYKAGRMTEAEKEARRREMEANATELDSHRAGRMRAAHARDREEESEHGAGRDTDDFVSSAQARMLTTEAGTLEGQVRRSRGKLALH